MKIEPATSTTARTNRLSPFKPVGRVADLKGGMSVAATIVAATAKPACTHP
jgi:hypothetical protein